MRDRHRQHGAENYQALQAGEASAFLAIFSLVTDMWNLIVDQGAHVIAQPHYKIRLDAREFF
jgi:hypothetical protein